MNIFYEVKSRVSLKNIAETYGTKINRNGMASCPFHNDKTPSMKIYDRGYCCYGCGEKGDTIAFVSKLFNISPYEAACKINSDFSLGLNAEEFPTTEELTSRQKALQHKKELESKEKSAWITVSTYYRHLRNWNLTLSPKQVGMPLNPLFVESLQQLETVSYLCNCLTTMSTEERIELIDDFGDEIISYQRRIDEIKKMELSPTSSVIQNIQIYQSASDRRTERETSESVQLCSEG